MENVERILQKRLESYMPLWEYELYMSEVYYINVEYYHEQRQNLGSYPTDC